MLSFLRISLFILCLWLLALPSRASHLLGGQITYEHLTGDQYRVLCLFYTNDGSVVKIPSIQLNCRIDGCEATDSQNFAVDINTSQTFKNVPFALSNGIYSNVLFETIVHLSPGNWTLSVQLEKRTNTNNLFERLDNYDFYVAADINTALAPNNSSPQFYTLPLPQVFWQQQNRYAYGASDADGDSLIYSLVAPQAACNQSIPYGSYVAGNTGDLVTNVVAPYSAGRYSSLFPVPSFRIDNSGAAPQAVPFFSLNATTGAVSSIPAPVMNAQGYFTVAVRVDEFRKLGTEYVKIGSVTREMPYMLSNQGDNFNPTLSALRVNNETATRPVDNTITVLAGQPLTLHFTGTDPDAGQMTQLYADIEKALPEAKFAAPTAGTATLQWQTTTQTRLGFYRFPVTVVDNSYPLRGFETRIITIRVVNAILAASDIRMANKVAAYPMPFTDHVTIHLAGSGRRQLVIVDALGRTVAELTTQADGSAYWQPTAALAPGVYTARASDGQSKRLLRVAP